MDWCRYRFRSVWRLAAPPEAVWAVLDHAEEYPRWWPQVREVVPLDDTTGAARFRSLLPYDLHVTVRAVRRDPGARVLEAALGGDLEGWARWTLAPEGTGTRALYEQEVEVRARLLRALAFPGRPFFRANHAWMMRRGRRGLAARLSSV
ncbi:MULTISPECIES: SRPBCC family protein [unclassified Streptomyces]|uniref:SRPBCC family protein n=1 Tax=unclassified Streptomyces TaxID=2593676 RepID=UPI0016614142|nr:MULTISPECIES: SRPBCC family protein [unclassified Streptomyces]MBD0706986.1 polyketide cyclase [Streptomyces sp. CBMA291]MBD0711737.1 polyketide cyclase [Streptomyces sp. CBMA291]MBD0716439.1 polyketide cyclase [Streptomyces sp. CBMA370]